jgi:hypothetical protein
MPAVHVHLNTPTLTTSLRNVEARRSFVQHAIESARAFFGGLAGRYTLHDPMAGEVTPEPSVVSAPAHYSINIDLSPDSETDSGSEDAKGEVGMDDETGTSDESELIDIDEDYNIVCTTPC